MWKVKTKSRFPIPTVIRFLWVPLFETRISSIEFSFFVIWSMFIPRKTKTTVKPYRCSPLTNMMIVINGCSTSVVRPIVTRYTITSGLYVSRRWSETIFRTVISFVGNRRPYRVVFMHIRSSWLVTFYSMFIFILLLCYESERCGVVMSSTLFSSILSMSLRKTQTRSLREIIPTTQRKRVMFLWGKFLIVNA